MEEFELELGEVVKQSVRQHWFLLVLKLIPYIVLTLAPIVILPLYVLFATSASAAGAQVPVLDISLGNSLVRFLLGTWWLFIWMATFTMLTKFFLTQWIITSTRIVDITQESLFSRRVSSFLLARVQDITTDISGVFPTLIGYGTLNVETAGREEKFSMEGIAHPEDVRDLIMREIADLQNHDGLGTKIAKTVGSVLI
ncbi:MAG: hypothetical protein AB203_01425 [Parcubacteria bacterium C7867-008]|nr:MAG: hypothetical protein AB203_01425 [Parcubacteria bacterium C7867-008]